MKESAIHFHPSPQAAEPARRKVYDQDQIVKSCTRIESGLRLGYDGVRSCCFGILVAPIFWTASQANGTKISHDEIIEKRRQLFDELNSGPSDLVCNRCSKVELKKYADVSFDKLGFIDLAHYTSCNLRCTYCGFTKNDNFRPGEYDPLKILGQFTPDLVDINSVVDFNGGEPSLLKNLGEYLGFFMRMRIRTRLYTNALRFRQEIYDSIENGTISWLITSLDAGTEATFFSLKQSNKFQKTIDNIRQYCQAARKGSGMVAVKYVFTDENSSQADIDGFTRIAIETQPTSIWLTFDFHTICTSKGITKPALLKRLEKQINAYADMFISLKNNGLDPVHFYKAHISVVDPIGDLIVEEAIRIINMKSPQGQLPPPVLDSRAAETTNTVESLAENCKGKRLAIAPASLRAQHLADNLMQNGVEIIALLDRNPLLHDREYKGIKIYAYDSIKQLNPDLVIACPPAQHMEDIFNKLHALTADTSKILLLEQDNYNIKNFF